MKAKKYYGVYGTNGFMVANNWKYVTSVRRFAISEHNKRFDTFYEAYAYACNGYNSLHPDKPYYGLIDKTNWWYYCQELETTTIATAMVTFY